MSNENVEASITVQVLPRKYLRWPTNGPGECYQAGDRLRVPESHARFLASPPDGSPAVVKIISED